MSKSCENKVYNNITISSSSSHLRLEDAGECLDFLFDKWWKWLMIRTGANFCWIVCQLAYQFIA